MMQRVSLERNAGTRYVTQSPASAYRFDPRDVSTARNSRDGTSHSQPLLETPTLNTGSGARALYHKQLAPPSNHTIASNQIESTDPVDPQLFQLQTSDPPYFLVASGSFSVGDGDRGGGGGNTDGCESDTASGGGGSGGSRLVSYAAKVRNSALLSGRLAPGAKAHHSSDASSSSLASAVEGASSPMQSRPGSHSSSLDRQRLGAASESASSVAGIASQQLVTIACPMFHEAHERRKSKLVDCRIHELRCYLHFDGSQKTPGNTVAWNGALVSPSAMCINYLCCLPGANGQALSSSAFWSDSYSFSEEQFELLVTDMKTRSVKAFDLQGRFLREFGAPPGTLSSSAPVRPDSGADASSSNALPVALSTSDPSAPQTHSCPTAADGAGAGPLASGGVYGIDIAMHPLTGQILVLEPHPKSVIQIFEQSGALVRTFGALFNSRASTRPASLPAPELDSTEIRDRDGDRREEKR